MPFEVKVEGADEVLKQLDAMTARIDNLKSDIPHAFEDWQRGDMHRHYPKVDGGETEWSTEIFSRGRHKPRPRKAGREANRKGRVRRMIRSAGHHPILRPELFALLVKRMTDLLASIKWQ